MKYEELKRRLLSSGWIIKPGAKHDLAVNKTTGKKIAVPRHRGDIPIGTAQKILKEAGLKK